MDGSVLVSAIVPVYNTKNYLPFCVEALAAQTYRELEILLVDDGSTDGTGALCDEFAQKYPAVRVLHKPNGGAASARFEGAQQAKGEYLVYVDSDDIPEPDYVERMLDAILDTGADCASCGLTEMSEAGEPLGKKYVADEPQRVYSVPGIFQLMFYDKKCPAALNYKMFRTDWIRAIEPIHTKLGEDSFVCEQYFLKCRSIVQLGYAGVRYRLRPTGAILSAVHADYYDYVKVYDALLPDVERLCPAAAPALRNKLVEDNFIAYLHLAAEPKKYAGQIAHITENIKHYRKGVMKDPRAEIRTRAACALSCLGMPLVAKVYGIFDKIRK